MFYDKDVLAKLFTSEYFFNRTKVSHRVANFRQVIAGWVWRINFAPVPIGEIIEESASVCSTQNDRSLGGHSTIKFS